MIQKCTPLFDRVLIEILEIKKTPSTLGLILPVENTSNEILRGIIVSVGPGRFNEDGDERIPLSVAVGDIVLFSQYGFDEVDFEEKKYLIGREDQLLAVISNTKKVTSR